MPHGQKNQNVKQKQYCNKFNKDFKNGPHQKKVLKKKKSLHDGLAVHLKKKRFSSFKIWEKEGHINKQPQRNEKCQERMMKNI